MRPWAVSAGLHLAALLLAVLCWPSPSAPLPALRLRLGAAAVPAAPAVSLPPARTSSGPAGAAAAAPVPAARPPVPAPAEVPGAGLPVEAPADPTPAEFGDPAPVPEPRRAAELADFAAPAYPARLRASGTEGMVVVGAEVDERGTVRRVWLEASSGQAEFDRRALDAVRRAVFRPAQESGRAVTDTTTVTVRFRLTS